MAHLLNKEVYSDYILALNEMELSLLLAGLELLDKEDKSNPEKSDFTLVAYLLEELKEMKQKS